jgi:hypothetical protein
MAGTFGKSLKLGRNPEWVVADAVVGEPVSTPKFPANREKNRDLFNSGAISGSDAPVSPMFWGLRAKFPTQQSREFLGGEQGISGDDQGNFHRQE